MVGPGFEFRVALAINNNNSVQPFYHCRIGESLNTAVIF